MATITLDLPDDYVSVLDDIGSQLPLIIDLGVSRLAPISIQAYMETVDLLSQNPSPELIANFRFSENIEERISSLLQRQGAGTLTKSDEVELDRIAHLELQLQKMKVQALSQLHTKLN